MKTVAPKRCAVYCRVSTDERLDQSFNSLDAQKDSGLAYIASQRAEGWIPVPDDYIDPGFSGGNIERPALKRLMADIEAGRIDIVVVYKIDRLTRNLTDFAKLIEVFERQRVSFVSVTQQFNTTTAFYHANYPPFSSSLTRAIKTADHSFRANHRSHSDLQSPADQIIRRDRRQYPDQQESWREKSGGISRTPPPSNEVANGS